jgi:hypothetical protein
MRRLHPLLLKQLLADEGYAVLEAATVPVVAQVREANPDS